MLTANQQSRLRGTKSSSSAKTIISISSNPYRSIWTTSTDPISSKQNAEAAAIEAYQRGQEEFQRKAVMSSSAQMKRRRSQRKGTSEGSHLEDALLGRRRSTRLSRKDSGLDESIPQPRQTMNDPPRSQQVDADSDSSRAKAPRATAQQSTSANDFTTASTSGRHTRRPNLAKSHIEASNSSQRVPTSNITEDAALSSLGMNDSVYLSPSFNDRRVSIRETQTDEEIMAIARDRCLQDFQVKRVYERRSGFLGTFGKRRPTINVAQIAAPDSLLGDVVPDSSPVLLRPSRAPPPLPVPSELCIAKRSPRNFSTTLKRRFINAFRKPSKTTPFQTSIPPQHVEAKDFRWTVKDYDLEANTTLSGKDAAAGNNDPANNLMIDEIDLVHDRHAYSEANKNISASQLSTAKSRITSWTNSTMAGTSTLRSRHLPYDDETHEQEQPARPATAPALPPPPAGVPRVRKVSSFFGRPVHNRLRKSSRADMRESSEQSKGLFDALQKRIRPKRSTQMTPNDDAEVRSESTTSFQTFTRAMLPSQSRQNLRGHAADYASSMETVGRRAPTVRTATPDPHMTAHALACDMFPPIQEVASPLEADVPLNIEPVVVRPTRQQLAQRMQRAKNRWRDPLASGERGTPRSKKVAIVEGLTDDMHPHNPYILSECHPYDHSLDLQQNSDLPHHARISPTPDASHIEDVHDKHSFLSPEYPPPPPPPAFITRTPPKRLYNPSRRNGQLHTYPKRVDSPISDNGHVTPSPTSQARTDPRKANGGALMSPSIYSRATDGASPRVVSPNTSPEVLPWRKYDMPANDVLNKTPTAANSSPENVVKRKESKVTFTADLAAVNFRDESDDDTEMLGGSIITVTGREVKRYRVPFSKSKTTPTSAEEIAQTTSTGQAPGMLQKHKVLTAKRKPSLEWRRWLSNELNIFRFGSGSKDVGDSKDDSRKTSAAEEVMSKLAREIPAGTASSDDAVEFEEQQALKLISASSGDAEPTGSSDFPTSSSKVKMKPSEERLPHSRHSSRPHIRSRATSRSSSSGYMNERYPMVASAIDVGAAVSIAKSRRRGPKKAASCAERTASSEPAVPEDDLPDHDDAFIEMSETNELAQAADAAEVPPTTHDRPPHVVPTAEVPMTRLMPEARTRSALELRVRYNAGAGQVSKALEVRKTRREAASHNALKQDNASSGIASQTRTNRMLVPQTVPAESLTSSSPPRISSRLEEDPTLMDISAGPYADYENSDIDVFTTGHATNASPKEFNTQAAGVEQVFVDHSEPVERHSATTTSHASFPSNALASDRRRQLHRKPAPSDIKVSGSSLRLTRPQHSAQRQATPIAADFALENNPSAAWLRTGTPPALGSFDSKTALNAKVSIGENMRPTKIRTQPSRPALGRSSKGKLHSQQPIEDSKDRKPSSINARTRRRQPMTNTTPHGHA